MEERDLLFRIFSMNSPKQSVQVKERNGNSKPPHIFKLGSLHLTRHLRETADTVMSLLPVPIKRQNEEYAVKLMRILGLESTAVDSIQLLPNQEDTLLSGLDNVNNTSSSQSERKQEKLKVMINNVEMRGLLSRTLKTKTNPYIKFFIGDQHCKTSVVYNSSSPTWKETFELFVNKSDIDTSFLSVNVFDKELIQRKRLLGSVNIKLSSMEMRNCSSWYALEGGDNGSTGEIHLCLTVASV